MCIRPCLHHFCFYLHHMCHHQCLHHFLWYFFHWYYHRYLLLIWFQIKKIMWWWDVIKISGSNMWKEKNWNMFLFYNDNWKQSFVSLFLLDQLLIKLVPKTRTPSNTNLSARNQQLIDLKKYYANLLKALFCFLVLYLVGSILQYFISNDGVVMILTHAFLWININSL